MENQNSEQDPNPRPHSLDPSKIYPDVSANDTSAQQAGILAVDPKAMSTSLTGKKRFRLRKAPLFIALIILAAAAVTYSQISKNNSNGYDSKKWVTFTEPQGNYKIRFPFKPEVVPISNQVSYGAKTKDLKEGYVISRGLVADPGPDTLENSVNSLIKNNNFNVIARKTGTVGGYGYSQIEYSENLSKRIVHSTVRFILVGDKMFGLTAITNDPDKPAINTDYFFNSFRLLN